MAAMYLAAMRLEADTAYSYMHPLLTPPNQKGASAFAMIMNHEYPMTIFTVSVSLQGPVDIFGLSFDTGSGVAYAYSNTAYIVVVSERRMGSVYVLLIFLLRVPVSRL